MYKLSGSKHINLAKIVRKGKNIYDDIPAVRRKRQAQKALKILKYASVAVIAICLLLVIFFAVHVTNIKLIYSGFTDGQDKLINAAALLKNKNYKLAINSAKTAENNFSGSLNLIEEYSSNFFIKKSSFFSAQFNDLLYLVGAGELLSRAVQLSADYGRAIDPIRWQEEDFYTLSQENKEEVLKEIYGRGPELNGIKANIALARLKLDNIKYKGILKLRPIRESIQNLSGEMIKTDEFLDNAIPLTELIPTLLGYPNEANNLIVFEDSRELWPTGGKIRAVGVLNLKNGEIKSLDSYSLSEFELAGIEGLEVPQVSPLSRYMGLRRWRLSEVNWAPDWPTTVTRVEYFINQSPICNNKNITGAIAINSEALSSILELSGPVSIDNIEYNKDNFISIFNETSDVRILGRLTKKILNSLLNKPISEVNRAVEVVIDNLSKKNVLLNFKNVEAQKVIRKKGWAGEFRETTGDFLAVVDSNFGNLKNEKDISRRIAYNVEESINGYFSELELSYSNFGSELRYINLFRVYTPLGSKLIDTKNEDGVLISTYNDLNRTVFSGYLQILPNSIKSIRINYKLPSNIRNSKGYTLNLEKQPGNTTGQVTVDVTLINKVKSYKPTGFSVYRKNDRNVRWDSDFEGDKIFVVNIGD